MHRSARNKSLIYLQLRVFFTIFVLRKDGKSVYHKGAKPAPALSQRKDGHQLKTVAKIVEISELHKLKSLWQTKSKRPTPKSRRAQCST